MVNHHVKTVRVLHISDLHLKVTDHIEKEIVWNQFFAKIEELCKEKRGLDLIVCSGDVASLGKHEEYGTAQTFFNALLKAADMKTTERLFVVPGNHDIDEQESTFIPQLDLKELENDEAFFRSRSNLQNYLRKFQGFNTFSREYLKRPIDEDHCYFSQTIDVGGFLVGVVGLNSAWPVCKGRASFPAQFIGKTLLLRALAEIKNADLKIAVFHHPVHWLLEYEQDRIMDILNRYADLVLTGHQWKPQIEIVSRLSPGRQRRILFVQSGPLYNTRWPPKANIIRWGVNRENGEVRAKLEPYSYDNDRRLWALDSSLLESIDYKKYIVIAEPKPYQEPVIEAPIREERAYVSEIGSDEDLPRLAKDSNFLQNRVEDLQIKKERIFFFGLSMDERVKDLAEKLTPQRIVFISGEPAVGKSVFMLHFLEVCSTQGLGDWRRTFFINPRKEYLHKTLENRLIQKKLNPKEFSSDDVLLVVDGLGRGEPDEEQKALLLFKEVREKGYRLLVTIRKHELEELKNKLGNRWTDFLGDSYEVLLRPDQEAVVPILKNLISHNKSKFSRFRELSEQEMTTFFSSKEFTEISEIIRQKSDGLVGYLNYLLEHLSRKGEFSKEAISRVPPEFTGLIKRIIEEDYLVGNDEVLPSVILLLTQEDFLSQEFVESFAEWGVGEIDKVKEMEKNILADRLKSRIKSLLGSYSTTRKESGIPLYRLNSHWVDAIEDFSHTDESTDPWIGRRNRLKTRLISFLLKKQGEFAKGEVSLDPDGAIFVLIGDIAQLSREKEILNSAQKILRKYDRFRDTPPYQFLKKRILNILIPSDNGTERLREDPARGLKSIIDGLQIDPYDTHLYYLASSSYRKMRLVPEASEYCRMALDWEPNNPLYVEEMGHILELKGDLSYEDGNTSLSIVTYGEALDAYKRAVEIIENLNPAERGDGIRQRNRLLWKVGYLNKRTALVAAEQAQMDVPEVCRQVRRLIGETSLYERKKDFRVALEILEKARETVFKPWIFLLVELDSAESVEIQRLVSEIYEHRGICYEEIADFRKATLNYLIHADLNEYSMDSFERYMKNGKKFAQWGFDAEAVHSFHRALRRNPRSYSALVELANVEGRLGRIDYAIGHLRRALETAPEEAAQRFCIDLLERYERRLETRESIGKKMMAIMDLSVSDEDPCKLSDEWLAAGRALESIDPEDILPPRNPPSEELVEKALEEIGEARILCLWQAGNLDWSNSVPFAEMERTTMRPSKTVAQECQRRFLDYFEFVNRGRNPLKGRMSCSVSEVFHHICYRAVATRLFGRNKRLGRLTAKAAKTQSNRISGHWGWLGKLIDRMNRSDPNEVKISSEVEAKCFEFSLDFNRRNRGSSNGYAWALFHEEKYDEALRAFADDMKLYDPLNSGQTNPASLTGIGVIQMKRGESSLALENLRKGAELRFRHCDEEPPEYVLKRLTESIESLKELAYVDPNSETAALKEVIRLYGMIEQVLDKTEVRERQLSNEGFIHDSQYLILLQSVTLRHYLAFDREHLTPHAADEARSTETKDLEMRPETALTNLHSLYQLIAKLEGTVQLLDKDLDMSALVFLLQLDPSKARKVQILSGRSHLSRAFKEECRALISEMNYKGIVTEIRILDGKDAQEIHDRYLVSDQVAYNTPPWNVIHRKLGDVKHMDDPRSKRCLFNKYWSRATDVSNIVVG